jgi:hypothetical protein
MTDLPRRYVIGNVAVALWLCSGGLFEHPYCVLYGNMTWAMGGLVVVPAVGRAWLELLVRPIAPGQPS